jgi:hypothetical protein
MIAPILLALFVQTPGDAPPKPIVLKAARLFDGKSDTLQTPGLIIV